MEYEKLLDKAYKEVKVVSSSSDRFETPKVVGKIEGKNTIITNFQQIAQYIRRPAEHLLKFLLKELATS